MYDWMDVVQFYGKDVVQVETGYAQSFVLTAQWGKVYAFGSNRQSWLGVREDMIEVQEPYIIRSLKDEICVQVASSKTGSHTLVLTNTGHVWAFGASACGALGLDADIPVNMEQMLLAG